MGTLTISEQAAPSVPSTGMVVIYPKTDGLVYAKDDAGVETKLSNDTVASSVTLGTPTAASSTSVDFTGISASAKKITVSWHALSTNGTASILLQLGDGAVETTGYVTARTVIVGATHTEETIGWLIGFSSAAAESHYGSIELTLVSAATNTWEGSGSTKLSSNSAVLTGGKALSAVLDRVRITTTNGTDTFDAGTINIAYQV